MEGNRGVGSTNMMDPMKLHATWHDTLPKLGLEQNYLGDTFPRCR